VAESLENPGSGTVVGSATVLDVAGGSASVIDCAALGLVDGRAAALAGACAACCGGFGRGVARASRRVLFDAVVVARGGGVARSVAAVGFAVVAGPSAGRVTVPLRLKFCSSLGPTVSAGGGLDAGCPVFCATAGA
jgi:hypothetical protein